MNHLLAQVIVITALIAAVVAFVFMGHKGWAIAASVPLFFMFFSFE